MACLAAPQAESQKKRVDGPWSYAKEGFLRKILYVVIGKISIRVV